MVKVIVIGGGAAGLMAAGQAAERGAEVVVFEKTDRAGNKVRLTGGGRCNLTNTLPVGQFIERFGENGRFLRQAFARFFTPELQSFFEQLGVRTVTEEGGRVFPASGRAADVVDALARHARSAGAELRTGRRVVRLALEQRRITGVVVRGLGAAAGGAAERVEAAAAVILAAGGASYPQTGSTGDGYALAAAAGHTIVPVRPALVPLETGGDVAPRLQGLSLSNAAVRLLLDGKRRAEARGEILFTHFGLSGPAVLSLSGAVVDALLQGRRACLSIDLRPGEDERAVDALVLCVLGGRGKRELRTLLRGLVPERLAEIGAELAGIDAGKEGHQVTVAERRRLVRWLKDFPLEVTGHRPLAEAMVTAGGVDTREIDPRTMASRLIGGLYFAGEVIDVNGDTGGFNLQAAFSTGWLAGRSAPEQETGISAASRRL